MAQNLKLLKEELRKYSLRCEETGKELGRGSYASVVELRCKGLKCAGKKIYRVLYSKKVENQSHRFVEECHMISNLRHPNIVQFLGIHFESDGVPMLVLEYLPMTLSQSLDKHGILPDDISYAILTDVILGLRYLHEQAPPIIHRDLSANNVLLMDNFRAKISDLGVAKIVDMSIAEASKMTTYPGTPCYMPPEALIPKPNYTTTIDIFSYGILIIHTFSGQWPLPSEANILDPNEPGRLIPVSECERRRSYIDIMGASHPMVKLTKSCLNNNSMLRPKATDIWKEVSEEAGRWSATYKERLERMLTSTTTAANGTTISSIGRTEMERKEQRKKAEVSPTESTQSWKTSGSIQQRFKIQEEFTEQREETNKLEIATTEKRKNSFNETKKTEDTSSSAQKTTVSDMIRLQQQKIKEQETTVTRPPERRNNPVPTAKPENEPSSFSPPSTAEKADLPSVGKIIQMQEKNIEQQEPKQQPDTRRRPDNHAKPEGDTTPPNLDQKAFTVEKPKVLAEVVFDFEARDTDELTIVKGEIVEVLEMEEDTTMDEAQWWLVQKGDSIGAVPSNFMKLLEPKASDKRAPPPPLPTRKGPPLPKQQEDFPPETGGVQIKNLIERLNKEEKKAGTGKGSQTNGATKVINSEEFNKRKKNIANLFGGPGGGLRPQAAFDEELTPKQSQANAEKALARGPIYIAMYDYEAADNDEVSFNKGDEAIDVIKIDEGWMEAKIKRTGQYGMVPINYFSIN